jgi:hypothetical protein
LQVFEDVPGCIVLSFHKHLAALEGDITTYMNQHYRTDLTVSSFKLTKDTVQWGVAADDDGDLDWGVFFVYWPPWAARPKLIPEHLAGPKPPPDVAHAKLRAQGPTSTRVPFGERTAAGMLTKYDVRPNEHTMRYKGRSLLGYM